jgi:hypothetical protein
MMARPQVIRFRAIDVARESTVKRLERMREVAARESAAKKPEKPSEAGEKAAR